MTKVVATDSNIKSLVHKYFRNYLMHGNFPSEDSPEHISNWDVRSVTNMRLLFSNNTVINNATGFASGRNTTTFLNLNKWDVSNVRDMSYMFYQCKFNEPLDDWDVTNVTNMECMFRGCQYFDQDLRNWNVYNVENMRGMFHGCKSFTKPLNVWNVSPNVQIDSYTFSGTRLNDANQASVRNYAKYFKQLRTEHVINNYNIRQLIRFHQDAEIIRDFGPISDWNVSQVTRMNQLFYRNYTFNEDISNWDVSNVTTMKYMFAFNIHFNQNISRWNVENVQNMKCMFYGATMFNQPLNWNSKVSQVTDMSGMFAGCNLGVPGENGFAQEHENIDGNVIDHHGLDVATTCFNQDISNWDVSNVTTMEGMFQFNVDFNQPLNQWGKKISNVKSMDSMFYYATAFNQPLNTWNIKETTTTSHMFDGNHLMKPEMMPSRENYERYINTPHIAYGVKKDSGRTKNRYIENSNVKSILEYIYGNSTINDPMINRTLQFVDDEDVQNARLEHSGGKRKSRRKKNLNRRRTKRNRKSKK